MMRDRKYSVWTVLGISVATAIVAATLIAWGGGVRGARSIELRSAHAAQAVQAPVRPASWFAAEPKSFADLAERVRGCVVNISTSKKVRRRQMMRPFQRFGPDDPFDNFFEKFFQGDPNGRAPQEHQSLGSGFIIDKNGTILTNNHVVSQADEIEVKLSDGRTFKADVLGTDEKTDIAVIKIKAEADLPTAVLGDSKVMRPGEWVMAIGNPFGLEQTVTVGVVSAVGRVVGGGPYARFIQTDASINPVNSGGPLFKMKGEVIGINAMIYAHGQGIGFAIPINLAKSEIPALSKGQKVTRGWLGVAIQEVTPELGKSFGLKKAQGALIAEVFGGSPAAKAGIRRGDIILKFGDEEIDGPYDLLLAVGQTKPDADITVVLLRGGKREEVMVDIGKQQEGEQQAGVAPEQKSSGKADTLGLVVRSISASDAPQLDVPATFRGVVVTRVEPGSAVERSDVRPGDVVLEINDVKIQSMKDYSAVTGKLKKGDLVRLFIKRGKSSIYLAFAL